MPKSSVPNPKFCEALGNSVAFFKRTLKLFDCLAAAIVVANPAGELLYWNPAAIQLYGFEPETEVQRPLGDFGQLFELSSAGEVVPLENWPMSRLLRREKVQALEMTVRRLETGQRWHHRYDGAILSAEEGEGEDLFVLTILDLTGHKETAAALKAERDRFQFIVDSVPGAIYSFCMQPDGSSCFPYASPSLSSMFGIDPELLKTDASPLFQMVSPEHLPELLSSIEQSRDSLQPWSSRIPFQHAERGACWADGQSIPTRMPDGSTIWHGYLYDSTERRSLEQQFWQAQKMDAVGRLAGGIAHDFNNLLTVINAQADMLIKEVDQADPIYPGLSQIRKAGERSARLTKQLLAFSREGHIEPRTFDANQLIRESQKMLGRLIGEDIKFQLHLAPAPIPLLIDQGQFEQLLLNLVVNARDAMPLGGRLTIATQEQGGELLLSVQDSGCGMSATTLSRIFEPFFTTKEVGKGTGLGLSVVHGVITRAGGRIEVESKLGEGTRFQVFFPLALQPIEQASAAPLDPAGGTETILLVEDEPAVRRVLVQGLKKYGYKVLVAKNGRSAIELAQRTQEKIDLMLSDVVMPGVSGPEAAQQIYQSRPDLKILFMTGYTEDVRIPPTILRKPFTAQSAAQRIREVLDADQAASTTH